MLLTICGYIFCNYESYQPESFLDSTRLVNFCLKNIYILFKIMYLNCMYIIYYLDIRYFVKIFFDMIHFKASPNVQFRFSCSGIRILVFDLFSYQNRRNIPCSLDFVIEYVIFRLITFLYLKLIVYYANPGIYHILKLPTN